VIVSLITINVVHIKTGRPNKRKHHQPVNRICFGLTTNTKTNQRIPAWANPRLQYSLTLAPDTDKPLDSPCVTNLIDSLITGNVSPSFSGKYEVVFSIGLEVFNL
jgi:hypothetical protein